MVEYVSALARSYASTPQLGQDRRALKANTIVRDIVPWEPGTLSLQECCTASYATPTTGASGKRSVSPSVWPLSKYNERDLTGSGQMC